MFNEFNKIFTFMTIAKERSFSRASKVLNISQPAVTLQIKKLEEMLDTTIIIRKKNGILLTKEGEKFYKLCQKFEHNLRAFKEEIEGIKETKSRLCIATTSLIQEAIIPLLLEKISNEFKIEIELKIQNEDMILNSLRERRSDICLLNSKLYADNIVFKPFSEYKFLFVSNKPVKDEIHVKDLHKLNFVKDSSKKYMDSLFESQSLRYEDFNTIYELDSTLAVINTLVHTNDNQLFAFLPEFLVKTCINKEKLYTVEVEGLEIKRPLYVAALKENEELINKFLNIKF